MLFCSMNWQNLAIEGLLGAVFKTNLEWIYLLGPTYTPLRSFGHEPEAETDIRQVGTL